MDYAPQVELTRIEQPTPTMDYAAQISRLRHDLEKAKEHLNNGGGFGGTTKLKFKPPLVRRTLKGHYGPIYAVDWGGDGDPSVLCSVSQDSKLIVWDANRTWKLAAIPEAGWAMSCAMEKQICRTTAFGGLDWNVYVHTFDPDIMDVKNTSNKCTLRGHVAYMSCCRFIDPTSMISSSGDNTCIYWDLEKGIAVKNFQGHSKDVMRISLSPTNKNVFVSGSVDLTCKLWDIRDGDKKAKMTFTGHEKDINTVEFFPSGNAFASGGDDESIIFHDLRAHQEVNRYNGVMSTSVNSLTFSSSGRILFAGYDHETPIAWDTLSDQNWMTKLSNGHTLKVSCLAVQPKGNALISGSWDHTLKVWA